MTTAKLRMPGLIAVLVSLVAGLTACGSGPGQINSAVIIDGSAISVDQVQALVDKVVAEQPAAQQLARERKLDLVAREALGQLIVHEVLDDAAERAGITADRSEVTAFLEQDPLGQELPTDGSVPPEQLVQQLVFRARDAGDYARDQVLLTMLAEEYLGRASVTYNLVQLDNAEDANTLAERIAASPADSEQLMNEAGGQGGAQLEASTGATPDGVYLTAPEGSVFVLPAGQGQGGFQVVHVLDRELSSQADPSAIAAVPPEQLPLLGLFALREDTMAADIEVSPRYGVWNHAIVGVVPKSEAEVSGAVLAPSDSARP
ncbi:SurA N-terminal domain-containing protein [Actinophytocola gossypii]|uniref:SurA N-terminal domain-containing protein n=1 Tax=Actinophytocola gossypii TaxID=2812003 RepID=A0ABT2J5A7_9PSEU|nr:SurA N-terminal domain-containing protein [Actinophytocola gossypii]MCT2583040.1 SurA N-terminal domain-containing protein [Actinophytocola gossypii]